MIHAPLGSRLLRSCYPTCPLTRLACSSSRTGLRRTSTTLLWGWRATSQATDSSHCGVGELATTSMRRRLPFSTATTRSSPMGVSYALLSGEAQTAWAISHSVIPIGGERIVTRSEGNVIYEIDDKPATDVLKEYLPEDALTDERDWLRYAISLALSFEAPSYMIDEEYVVRGVPQLNLTDESITVQTEVEEGTSIWFSSRDKEKITTGFD